MPHPFLKKIYAGNKQRNNLLQDCPKLCASDCNLQCDAQSSDSPHELCETVFSDRRGAEHAGALLCRTVMCRSGRLFHNYFCISGATDALAIEARVQTALKTNVCENRTCWKKRAARTAPSLATRAVLVRLALLQADRHAARQHLVI